MTRTEHLLTILAEECAEVAQRASKALRFGLSEIEPGQNKTNARRIADEINDLVAVYQMLAGPVVSPTSPLFAYGNHIEYMEDIRAKQTKVEKYLAYSAECGTLSEAGEEKADPSSGCPQCLGHGIVCCCGKPLDGGHDHDTCGPPIPCDHCERT